MYDQINDRRNDIQLNIILKSAGDWLVRSCIKINVWQKVGGLTTIPQLLRAIDRVHSIGKAQIGTRRWTNRTAIPPPLIMSGVEQSRGRDRIQSAVVVVGVGPRQAGLRMIIAGKA